MPVVQGERGSGGSASAPRTSPTITRSGFIGRLIRTRSAAVTSPDPRCSRRGPRAPHDRGGCRRSGRDRAPNSVLIVTIRSDGDTSPTLRGERPQHRRLPRPGRTPDDDPLSTRSSSRPLPIWCQSSTCCDGPDPPEPGKGNRRSDRQPPGARPRSGCNDRLPNRPHSGSPPSCGGFRKRTGDRRARRRHRHPSRWRHRRDP